MRVNKYRRIYYFLFMLSLLLVPVAVDAANRNLGTLGNQVCLMTGGGSNAYKIRSRGSKVFPSRITYQDYVGNSTYPEKCLCSNLSAGESCVDENNVCLDSYRFELQSLGTACKITSNTDDGYTFYTCPSESSYNVVSKMKESMEISYVPGSNQYKVTFNVPSEFRGKVSAKSVGKTMVGNTPSFAIDKDSGLPNIVTRNYSANDITNGIYLTPGSDFYLIFYLNDPGDECNGERLGYISGAVPSTVPNPMYNDSICIDIRRKYPEGSFQRLIVSGCDQEKIQNYEYSTIRSTILKKIEELNEILSQTSTEINTDFNFSCGFKVSDNSINVNSQPGFSTKVGFLDVEGVTGKYWKAFCTETISIEYDDPKAVNAGQGFGYQAKVNVVRTCTPYKIAEPKFLPSCRYSVECWGGPANHNGEAGAGPNEDFDSCINTCDGGKYSQNCINSCYQNVYGMSNKLSSSRFSNISFLSSTKQYNLTKVASKGDDRLLGSTTYTKLPVSSKCVISGNNIDNGCGIQCDGSSWCKTEHGVGLTYLNGCNSNGQTAATLCYEVYTNYPCSGSEAGIEKYKREIEASEAEYNKVVHAIQNFSSEAIKNEKYQISIDEEYDKQKNGSYKNKTTVFNNSSGNNTITTSDTALTGDVNLVSTAQGSTNIAAISGTDFALDQTYIDQHISKPINQYQISRELTLDIGAAYVSKINGNEVKYNDKNTLTNSTLDNDPLYYNYENKYFTNYNTRFVNNYKNWPYYNNAASYSTSGYTKNIHVRLNNIGSWNQWGSNQKNVDVECFYGTASSTVCLEEDPNCGDPGGCDPNDICTGGFTYIYRVIDLTDMFPNTRNPRWNWTGTINQSSNTTTGAAILPSKSIYGDAVDPSGVISHVEGKGESIYNVTSDASEVDYEFVLTKENIRNIRSYNKKVRDYNNDGANNYLDFNMSCYKNSRGQEVCTSRFLDNINGNSGSESSTNFITYSVGGFSIEARKSLAGCNNAINGNSCFTISR